MEFPNQIFLKRSDEHIQLSNQQVRAAEPRAVNASMMYATARFNAWTSAIGWDTKEQMKQAKAETIEHFLSQYRKMLEENFDDYINRYDDYIGKNRE